MLALDFSFSLSSYGLRTFDIYDNISVGMETLENLVTEYDQTVYEKFAFNHTDDDRPIRYVYSLNMKCHIGLRVYHTS